MRYLLLTLTVGCAAIEPSEVEGEVVAALIGECPIGQWCIEAPALTGGPLLHDVFALGAGDVYAVGDNGTILRRNNNEWIAQDSGTTRNLRGVWAASSSDVWAVGVSGTIVRFDGTVWTLFAGGGTSDIDAVWGSSANDVWLVGSSRVLHWDGARFTSVGFAGTMLSVHGTGPTDVWVTGENTNVHHFTGAIWEKFVPTSLTTTFFSVLAIAPGDAWAATWVPSKEAMHLVAGKWSAKPTGNVTFQSMAAVTASDIWAVGDSYVAHWNGLAWSAEQPFGTNQLMWAVTTTAGNAWLVGNDGLIARRTF